MHRKRREGWLQRCPLSYDQARCVHPPSVECFAIQAFSIVFDFGPKLMPKVQNQTTIRKVCIVIQPVLITSFKSLFYLQRGSRETLHASRLETRVKCCPRRNQRRAAQAVWVRCEPSNLQHNSKTDELAVVLSEENRICHPGTLLIQAERGNPFRERRQVSENSELGKKFEPGVQFQCEQTSSIDQPSRFTRGSEVESTTSSWYSSFREKKVVKGLTAFSDKQSFAPHLTSTFSLGVWLKARKRITYLSSPHRVHRLGSAQVYSSFSEPVVLQIRHI